LIYNRASTPDSSDDEVGLLLDFDLASFMHRLDKLEKDIVQLKNDHVQVKNDRNDNRSRFHEFKRDYYQSEQKKNLRFDSLTLAIQNGSDTATCNPAGRRLLK
jgi:uncharacterized protein YpbB